MSATAPIDFKIIRIRDALEEILEINSVELESGERFPLIDPVSNVFPIMAAQHKNSGFLQQAADPTNVGSMSDLKERGIYVAKEHAYNAPIRKTIIVAVETLLDIYSLNPDENFELICGCHYYLGRAYLIPNENGKRYEEKGLQHFKTLFSLDPENKKGRVFLKNFYWEKKWKLRTIRHIVGNMVRSFYHWSIYRDLWSEVGRGCLEKKEITVEGLTEKMEEILSFFQCTIKYDTATVPAILSSGHTIDFSQINGFLRSEKRECPCCNKHLTGYSSKSWNMQETVKKILELRLEFNIEQTETSDLLSGIAIDREQTDEAIKLLRQVQETAGNDQMGDFQREYAGQQLENAFWKQGQYGDFAKQKLSNWFRRAKKKIL